MGRQSWRLGRAAALALAMWTVGAVAKTRGNRDFLGDAQENARRMVHEGKQIFRFDTFGDEAFWNRLGLNQVVSSLSPRARFESRLRRPARGGGRGHPGGQSESR